MQHNSFHFDLDLKSVEQVATGIRGSRNSEIQKRNSRVAFLNGVQVVHTQIGIEICSRGDIQNS